MKKFRPDNWSEIVKASISCVFFLLHQAVINEEESINILNRIRESEGLPRLDKFDLSLFG